MKWAECVALARVRRASVLYRKFSTVEGFLKLCEQIKPESHDSLLALLLPLHIILTTTVHRIIHTSVNDEPHRCIILASSSHTYVCSLAIIILFMEPKLLPSLPYFYLLVHHRCVNNNDYLKEKDVRLWVTSATINTIHWCIIRAAWSHSGVCTNQEESIDAISCISSFPYRMWHFPLEWSNNAALCCKMSQ